VCAFVIGYDIGFWTRFINGQSQGIEIPEKDIRCNIDIVNERLDLYVPYLPKGAWFAVLKGKMRLQLHNGDDVFHHWNLMRWFA